jgi:hypothetical protein
VVALDNVLARLDLVRRSPRGFMARCPAHDDRVPSLSVRELYDRVALHCFAGCLEADVWRALDLEPPGGTPAPLTIFRRALATGRAQARRRGPDRSSEVARLVAELRADATRMGDDEEAWELLAEAAAHERICWAMTA